MEWREEAYTLDELADYLDLSASARRSIDKHYGMGRNCHLFEMTRKWAYRAIRQGWPEFSQWLDAVIQRVEMYNASLPVPLSPPECRAIGKSIAKYTHRNFTPETFAQYVADTHTLTYVFVPLALTPDNDRVARRIPPPVVFFDMYIRRGTHRDAGMKSHSDSG